MKKIILSIILFFSLSNNSFSQKNDTEAMLYNVGFGGVFGTIGAIINKKPSDKIDKIIFKGFAQGALGGYITFESKRILRLAQEQEDWKLIWAAKLVNAGGTSIKENAALNRNFWDKWHINFSFNRIEFDTKDKFKISYKIMPITFVYTSSAFFYYKFDIKNSLNFGEFIFYKDRLENSIAFTHAGYIVYDYNHFNNPTTTSKQFYQTGVHEIIHLYQSNDYSVFNTYYTKPLQKLETKSNFLKKIDNFIYYDLHYIPLRAVYSYETNTAGKYYDNYLEHEAGYYSNTIR